MKPRILYLLSEYPQLSETYVKTEIEALQPDFDIFVVAFRKADLPYRRHVPFELTREFGRVVQIIRDFKPCVLHAHYLNMAPVIAQVAAAQRLPYTIRAHSFDVLALPPGGLTVNEHCLGVLVFPFTRPLLESKGLPPNKIVDCYPAVNFARFHDRSPNGDGVLNLGACLPKKRFEDFIDLACLMPGATFNLYTIGYATEALADYNRSRGGPVNLCPTVEPEEMPAVYKRHQWLVYTACPKLATVGWPMAVAEAQAAGLGVCLPNLRPDLAEYLGGAGYLYDSVQELPAILSRPYPEEMREKGFEQARKSDIQRHKTKLTDLWQPVLPK